MNFYCFHGQQFSLLGNAQQVDALTYELTQSTTYQKGMMTNYYPVDLGKNFSILFQLNFGTRDNYGADGFAFILSKVCNPKLIDGGGLGADNIGNSIIAEFDTYYNTSTYDQDPPEDHIGIYKDGLVSRKSGAIMDLNSNNPITMPNLEDGLWHDVAIKWTYISATSQKLEVFFDGVLKQSSTQNHISNRFLNNKVAFWSISAATGLYYNLQKVKVKGQNNNLSFNCGQVFQLTAPSEGTNYTWSPVPISATGNTANFVCYTSQTITCTYNDYCGELKSVNFNIVPIPVVPTFTINDHFCEGTEVPILPIKSDNGFFGSWIPAVVSNAYSGDYTFSPDIDCVTPITLHITVDPKPITTNITPN